MFTGIIEEIGIIESVSSVKSGAVVSVKCKKILEGLKLGDSIAVNGACQTVISFNDSLFSVEVSEETLSVTTFLQLKTGSKVNLERAMPANGRFDGHIVSGHVDGKGSFLRRIDKGLSSEYWFGASEEIMNYVVYKGSITVNGISLTVAGIKDNSFSVAVIPHTEANTNLGELKSGIDVNLESDILAKYIEKFVTKNDNKNKRITLDYLEEHGFLD